MFTIEEDILIEETQLWRAVIEQAKNDFQWEPVDMVNQPLYRTKFNAKKTTEWWLGTDDFYEVCQLASLKADEVLEQFKPGGDSNE